MTIFVLLIMDRHTDPGIELFSSFDGAKTYADDYLSRVGKLEEDEEIIPGWMYYVRYSREGDYIAIFKRKIR